MNAFLKASSEVKLGANPCNRGRGSSHSTLEPKRSALEHEAKAVSSMETAIVCTHADITGMHYYNYMTHGEKSRAGMDCSGYASGWSAVDM